MTTYPTYQSPIRSFQELGITTDNIDPKQLKLERKRLLLEIQISDTQSCFIREKELSKNDVIKLFDELEGATHLNYHQLIFNHSVLLNLLENYTVSGDIEDQHKIRFETEEEWSQFIAFISPYVANAIDKSLTKTIRHSDFSGLEKVKNFFKLLTNTDSYFAFRKFSNFCETLDDRLELLAYRNKEFPSTDVQFLKQSSFYNCINELTNIYPDLPNSVATSVINFTVNCERKKGRGKHLIEISDEARRLHCSAQLRAHIINNREAFWESREQFLKYNPNVIWRVLVGIIIIGSWIARMNKGCESSNNRNTYEPMHQELLEKIKQLDRDDVTDYSITTVSSGNANFDESSFLNLHEKVIKSTELSEYRENQFIPQGEPKILSRFKSTIAGSTYNLSNETSSDLLMIVLADSSLNSFYVKAGSSTTFLANETSSIFFYSGTRWKENRTIEHWHQSPKTNALSQIRFNGYFALWTEENFQFLRKYFTLTDGDSNDFKVTNENGIIEFFQGDRHVNYSF
ncbi:hypothetical protein N9F08_00485 [bacterium]|nr:hypothetical protein [bacterium]